MKWTTREIISQEGGFINFSGPVMRAGIQLMKNALTWAANNISLPLEVTAAASAADANIRKKL